MSHRKLRILGSKSPVNSWIFQYRYPINFKETSKFGRHKKQVFVAGSDLEHALEIKVDSEKLPLGKEPNYIRKYMKRQVFPVIRMIKYYKTQQRSLFKNYFLS